MSLVRRRHAILALALVTTACDPDEVLGDVEAPPAPVDPAKQAADAAAKQVADTTKAQADRFATCMAGCFEGKALSPTDRQTCRLTCGADRLAAAGPSASADAKAALGRFEACLVADCTRPGTATDAATCRLTCAQAALAGPAAPALATTARGCAVSCLEQTGDCGATCTGSADDAATCRLQCTSLGERCLGRCDADPSARPKLTETPPDAEPFAGAAKASPPPAVPKQTLDTLPAPP